MDLHRFQQGLAEFTGFDLLHELGVFDSLLRGGFYEIFPNTLVVFPFPESGRAVTKNSWH